MKISALFLTCSIFIFLLRGQCAAFTIETPPDKGISTQATVSVIVRYMTGEMDTIRVFHQNRTLLEKTLLGAGGRYCLQLELEKGLNNLEIQGLRNGTVSSGKTIQIYLQGRLSNDAEKPPSAFTPYTFHSPANEKKCAACHVMEATAKDVVPRSPESSSCYSCHAAKDKGVLIHYPARQWYCPLCHRADSASGRHSVPGTNQNYCYMCHSSNFKEWQKLPVIHGPVAKGQCSLCHAPHSSNHPSLLRLHTTDLCIKCHEEKASGTHVISGFYGKGHPVRGVRDPLHPEREFTCASCHNPHAGKNRDLLRHNRDNMTEYCQLCHKL